jgi:hypothetical protein
MLTTPSRVCLHAPVGSDGRRVVDHPSAHVTGIAELFMSSLTATSA